MSPRLDTSNAAQVAGASAHSTLPAASPAPPSTNTRLRPKVSARLPAISSAAARPRLMLPRIQVCPAGPAPSASAISPSVASGAVKFTSTRNAAAHAITSVAITPPVQSMN